MVSRNRNLDKRTNWFDRQFVRAQDFVDADDYALDRHRRHIRTLHTPGVAEGLRVAGDIDAGAITVDAGTAVDALGREIVVLTQLPAVTLPTGSANAEVYLVYDESFDDPSTDPGVDGFTRIREIASVAIRKLDQAGNDPVPTSPGERPVPGILLAAVSLNGGKLTATPDNSVRSTAGAVIGVAALDGVSLRRPGHSADEYPRITADADTGAILFSTGTPPTERLRIEPSGRVAIGTVRPLPGALTLEDPTAPLSLRQAGGPSVGGAWRAAVAGSALRFDANIGADGEFSTTRTLLALRAAGGDPSGSPDLVTVGAGGNAVLQTRHINGKAAGTDNDDGLFLNWATGKSVEVGSLAHSANLVVHGDIAAQNVNGKAAGADSDDSLFLNQATGKSVEVGSEAHRANLNVHGEIAAQNFPADNVTPALAALSVASRGSDGKPITWKIYTAAVGGGFGVRPNHFEIWHYDTLGGALRFAINRDGNTFLCPEGGNLYIKGVQYTTSDARLKTDIAPLEGALGRLTDLRGVSYVARTEPDGGRRLGVVAQEVAEVYPELVTVSERDGYQAVNYQGIIAVLVEAVKELGAEVGRLRARMPAEQS